MQELWGQNLGLDKRGRENLRSINGIKDVLTAAKLTTHFDVGHFTQNAVRLLLAQTQNHLRDPLFGA